MRVNTNSLSLSAQRAVSNSRQQQERALTRLSSGDRIFQAGEDPSGLAISEKMRSHITSMGQAERNAQESISMFQVGEGALATIHEITTRLRELSVQAATDTLGDGDRLHSEKEFQQLKEEIGRISASTNYNGKALLNGSQENYEIQVGIHHNEHEKINYDMSKILRETNLFGGSHISVATKEAAQDALDSVTKMINEVSNSRANVGSITKRVESSIQTNMISKENLSASRSKIRDADYAAESANSAKSNIIKETGINLLSAVNATPGRVLQLIS